MPTPHTLLVFSAAALVLALMPGPGIFYVVGRTLAAGRRDGFASCAGTMLGGLVHVAAGAAGVSALIIASAGAFSALKLIGGVYLVVLAVRMWRSAGAEPALAVGQPAVGISPAFRQAILVEATNPKTAAFFLALVPQFIEPAHGGAGLQFAVLGVVAVGLNTLADMAAVALAGLIRDRLTGDRGMVRRLRRGSAVLLGGLGVSMLMARRAG